MPGVRRGGGRGSQKKQGIVSKMSEDLCPNVLQALDPRAGPMLGVPGGTGQQDMHVRIESRGQKKAWTGGPEPRASHWCRIWPEWRIAPLRRGRQKPIKSTRQRIRMVAAYNLSFFGRASACGVLECSVKSRPRSELLLRRGPCIRSEL